MATGLSVGPPAGPFLAEGLAAGGVMPRTRFIWLVLLR